MVSKRCGAIYIIHFWISVRIILSYLYIYCYHNSRNTRYWQGAEENFLYNLHKNGKNNTQNDENWIIAKLCYVNETGAKQIKGFLFLVKTEGLCFAKPMILRTIRGFLSKGKSHPGRCLCFSMELLSQIVPLSFYWLFHIGVVLGSSCINSSIQISLKLLYRRVCRASLEPCTLFYIIAGY